MAGAFELASFYACVEATPRERSWLRQDLVRGLKDWYLHVYGYDRYGAETAFLLGDRMGEPHIFGFAMLRILRDRRISEETKARVVTATIASIAHQSDLGTPYGLVEGLLFLALIDQLTPTRLRYALLAVIGHEDPFAGIDAATARSFVHALVTRADLPPPERAFWAHSLVINHIEGFRSAPLIDTVMREETLPSDLRSELCWSWVHQRQPRLDVQLPRDTSSEEGRFATEHMPFWIAHMRSWPRASLMRRGLLWLSRLGEDPLSLAQVFIAAGTPPDEQALGAVADIIAERHTEMPPAAVKRVIEQGIAQPGSIASRRRFYRLGAELVGPEYLSLAAQDPAASVRQWAARQLQAAASAPPEEEVPLAPSVTD